MDSTAMKPEHGYSVHQDDDFDGGQWVHIADERSPHHSPLQDYNSYFISPTQVDMDSIYTRTATTSHSSNPPLYPLIVPQWPSQLTNPSINPSISEPHSSPPAPTQAPRPIAPVTTVPATQSSLPSPTPIPTPATGRRTLTDQDRRRMCQYHEENPTVKQTEIGCMYPVSDLLQRHFANMCEALFGVERSTVSKVLRQKEKYLHPDDGSRSPIKRSKGKFPDIERALSNWAKNNQRQGLPLNDDMIRDKARMFATTVGSSECLAKVNSSVWLEKFKQKNELLGAKLPPSETNDSDMGDPPSGSQTPIGISPVSPTGQAPTSPNQDPLKTEALDGQTDFQATYRRNHSQSTNSLASCYTETTMPSTFSPDLRSPNSPFFSPASSCGPSPNIPSPMPRLPALASADSRPRRQTFPNISAIPSYITPPASASTEQSPTNKFLQQSMANTALESPLEEMEDPSLRISSAVQQNHSSQQQQLLQSASSTPISSISPSSMAPPPNPSPVTVPIKSPHLGSSQSPPSQDEARRALEVLMNFFQYQPSAVDPQDYIIMGKLMERLKLRGDELPGGMRSMERGDGTMPMGRKRSIHSL